MHQSKSICWKNILLIPSLERIYSLIHTLRDCLDWYRNVTWWIKYYIFYFCLSINNYFFSVLALPFIFFEFSLLMVQGKFHGWSLNIYIYFTQNNLIILVPIKSFTELFYDKKLVCFV